MDPEQNPFAAPQMLNIDGPRIRRIREEKGLTQLYVATVVGVTTDTVSRWENRRYPTIKKENALKLAEALETELEAIVDQGTKPGEAPPPEPEVLEPTPSPPPTEPPPRSFLRRRPIALSIGLLLLVAVAIFVGLRRHKANDQGQVIAIRTLPPHAAQGTAFPVLIELTSSLEGSSSLILKESLQGLCRPSGGIPPFTPTGSGKDASVIKWLGRIEGEQALYAYMVTISPDAGPDALIRFDGSITGRNGNRSPGPVAGSDSLRVAPFHWADRNRDRVIDDDEILSVFDTYGAIVGLDFGRGLLEAIWSGGGYRFNPSTRAFEVLPITPKQGRTEP